MRPPTARGPDRRLSLRKNFSWLAVGRIVHSASQWGVLAVLAKLSTSYTVGEFTYALAISSPILSFARMGLRRVYATDTRAEFRFGDYLGFRALCGMLALVVICAAGLVLAETSHSVSVVVLVGLAAVIPLQSDMLFGLFQTQERLDHVARSLILRGLLSLALLALGVAITGDLVVGVMGQVVGNFLVYWLYDAAMARRRLKLPLRDPEPGSPNRETAGGDPLRRIFEWSALRRLGLQALPLGFVAVLGALSENVSRYVIVERLGVEALGYFGVMIYVVVAANRTVAALGTAAVVRLARDYAAGRSHRFLLLLGKMAGVGLAFGGAGLLIAVVAGRPILTLLYAPEYARYTDVFQLVMAAGVIRYVATLLSAGVTAARLFRLQVAQQALVLTTALVASLLLIGPYGLRGAAFAVMLTFGVQLASVVVLLVWSLKRIPRSDMAQAATGT